MEIKIRVNGEELRLQQTTIESLVRVRELDDSSLVVERNGCIVKQAEWSTVLLEPGDVVELLNFVGGG